VSEYDDIVRGPGHTGQSPQRRDPSPPEAPPAPEADEAGEDRGVPRIPGLVRASDLIDLADRDQGDFEPGGLYKGFKILPREQWPEVSETMPDPGQGVVGHANQKRRFYVESPKGTVGLVPWEGSQIVWPWEAAWAQDLYRPEVHTLLKDEPKRKKG
jgi:hypothetical protein